MTKVEFIPVDDPDDPTRISHILLLLNNKEVARKNCPGDWEWTNPNETKSIDLVEDVYRFVCRLSSNCW